MNTDAISSDEAKKVTIQSYNEHIGEYIDKDNTDDVRTLAYWPGVEYFLSQLPKSQTVFEIGSGTGADARRIENKGFTVTRSDVTEGFLQHMRANGHDAVRYDVLEKPLEEKQAAVLANAVFLHFTPEQFRLALANVHESLAKGGLFCLGMKLGDFEGWREKGLSGKRYFKLWSAEDLQIELTKAGFAIINPCISSDGGLIVITARRGSGSK